WVYLIRRRPRSERLEGRKTADARASRARPILARPVRSTHRRLAIAVGRDPADKFAEILGLAKIAVDRGKAHIGDLIERRQRLHHQFTDHIARDLGLARAFELAYQRIDDALDPVGLVRSLAQRDIDRAGELVAVERLALTVLLD